MIEPNYYHDGIEHYVDNALRLHHLKMLAISVFGFSSAEVRDHFKIRESTQRSYSDDLYSLFNISGNSIRLASIAGHVIQSLESQRIIDPDVAQNIMGFGLYFREFASQDQLIVLEALVKHAHFQRLADELSLSHSQVSRKLQSMEKQYGFPIEYIVSAFVASDRNNFEDICPYETLSHPQFP